MQEVVSAFIIGYWASSRIAGSSHVNFSSPPPNIVEVMDVKLGEEYPIAFYKLLISWFTKDGDTVLEIGCRNEVGNVQKLSYYVLFLCLC